MASSNLTYSCFFNKDYPESAEQGSSKWLNYQLSMLMNICHWEYETGIFQFVFRCFAPTPHRPKMPFTYVVNFYSDMSLSKGHLG